MIPKVSEVGDLVFRRGLDRESGRVLSIGVGNKAAAATWFIEWPTVGRLLSLDRVVERPRRIRLSGPPPVGREEPGAVSNDRATDTKAVVIDLFDRTRRRCAPVFQVGTEIIRLKIFGGVVASPRRREDVASVSGDVVELEPGGLGLGRHPGLRPGRAEQPG